MKEERNNLIIEKLRELEDEFFDPETGDYTDEAFYAEDVIWKIENFIKKKIGEKN